MEECRRTSRSFIAFSSVILFAALLVSCSNTEQYTKKVDELEKEKIALESKIKELESLQQQAITAKDTEIAKLKELNETLDAQVKELQKQFRRSDNQVTGRKLSQGNAEKAIKGFASTNSVSPILGTWGVGDCSFNIQSIASIQPLNQFTETEATSIVILKCTKGALAFKFVFQRDIDNRWFLTKIDGVEGVNYTTGQVESMISRHQNLKVPAQ